MGNCGFRVGPANWWWFEDGSGHIWNNSIKWQRKKLLQTLVCLGKLNFLLLTLGESPDSGHSLCSNSSSTTFIWEFNWARYRPHWKVEIKLQKCQSNRKKMFKLKSKNSKTQIENKPPTMSGTVSDLFIFFCLQKFSFFFFGVFISTGYAANIQ